MSDTPYSWDPLDIKVCHTCESHHSPKNIVPCIKIRYSVKKFSWLMSSRQAKPPSKILSCVGRDLQLYTLCLHKREEGCFALKIFFTISYFYAWNNIFGAMVWFARITLVWHTLLHNKPKYISAGLLTCYCKWKPKLWHKRLDWNPLPPVILIAYKSCMLTIKLHRYNHLWSCE